MARPDARARPAAGPTDDAEARPPTSAQLWTRARSSQFLAAAMELLEETGDVDFTVQQIVERTQLSLRAFYEQFASKDELLRTLFTELVSQFTDDVAAEIPTDGTPLDQLEAYVRTFAGRAGAAPPFGDRAWTIYQMRLAADHPGDYARAITHQLDVLGGIVRAGREQGQVRSDLPDTSMTLLINATLVATAQAQVFGVQPDGMDADALWRWCHAALVPVDG